MNIKKHKLKYIFAGGLAVCLLPTMLRADQATQQLLREIEKLTARVEELESTQGKQAESELDDLTADVAPRSAEQGFDAPGSSFVRNIISNTTIGGYASSEFENFQGKDSAFDQHRFVTNISSSLHKRLRFYSEVELEHGSIISSEGEANGQISIDDTNGNGVIDADEAADIEASLDTQNGRGGELEVEQVWMQYDFNDNIGLRTGVILAPFGRFNIYHDDDLQNLTDRPLVDRRVIPTTWSEAGLGFVFNYDLTEEATLGGEVYLVNGFDDGFSGGSGGMRGARSSAGSDTNNNKAVVGRVVLSPSLGHEIGLSGYHGAYDPDSNNDITGGAVDWLLTLGDLRFLGEAAIFDLDDGVNSSGQPAPDTIGGVYAELNYSFWCDALNSTFLGESFSDPKLIGSFRYNYAEINRINDLSNLDQNSYVVGLGYRPVPSFVFKTEWQWNDGELERKNSNGFIGSVAIGF